jgi:hypothetical protein
MCPTDLLNPMRADATKAGASDAATGAQRTRPAGSGQFSKAYDDAYAASFNSAKAARGGSQLGFAPGNAGGDPVIGKPALKALLG